MASTLNNGIPTLQFNKVRNIVQSEPEFDWFQSSKSRLNKLASLPRGWDGYKAPPVSLYNAIFALNVLEQICSVDTPAPEIVPGVNGNCQIEWHTLKGDLELNIKSPNNVDIWYSDLSNIEEPEIEMHRTNNFTGISDLLTKIIQNDLPYAAAA